ncbi:hypothetical protein ACIQ34_11010 [Ureibacillus sp. NPDC094379]
MERTLNSGPIHIPTLNQAGATNNRLVITIKNNSNRTLQANVIVEACFPRNTVINLPSVRNLAENVLEEFRRRNIPAHTCRVFEVAITANSRPFIKVISTGDYEVIKGRPAAGELEISVVAGNGATNNGDRVTGLSTSDASTFVPFGSWVVEERC